jgi:hypothetical protein
LAGFPAAEPGWDFGQRVLIGGVRGACRRTPISHRCGIAKTVAAWRALEDWVRIVRVFGVVLQPIRRSQRVSWFPIRG